MKTLVKLSLTITLSAGIIQCCFSQSAAKASKEVTPPIPENYHQEVIDSLSEDNNLGEEALDLYGLRLPFSIDTKLASGNAEGAWSDFENFIKDLGKEKRAQILEAEIMLCNKIIPRVADPSKWKEKRETAQKALLTEFPKWTETYNSLINPDATPTQIIEYTTKAIQCDPQNYRTYERRGKTYIQLGRISAGCADFEKCPDKEKIVEYNSYCKAKE